MTELDAILTEYQDAIANCCNGKITAKERDAIILQLCIRYREVESRAERVA